MQGKITISRLLAKGIFHIFLGSVLAQVVSSFASIIVVRNLSKADYGLMSYYENLYGFFFLMAGFGLANSLLRYVVIADSQSEKVAVLSYCCKTGSLFNLFLLSVGVIFSFIYRHPCQFEGGKHFFAVMFFFLPFQYVANLYILNKRAFFNNKGYAFYSFLSTFFLSVFKVFGAVTWGVFGALIVPLFVHVLFSIALIVSGKRSCHEVSETLLLPCEKKTEINKYALKYMFANGLWTLFALNGTFILGRTIGSAELIADYRIASFLPTVVSLVSTSMGVFVAPYFTKREAGGEYEWVKKYWIRNMFASVLLIGGSVLILFLGAPFMVRMVFGEKYTSAFPIMRLLLISVLFGEGIRYPTANLLAAMNKIFFNIITSCVGIVLQLVSGFYLSFKYSIRGIAYSNILVQIVMSVLINVFFLVCFFANRLEKNK